MLIIISQNTVIVFIHTKAAFGNCSYIVSNYS